MVRWPSRTLGGDWLVKAQPDAEARLRDLLGLAMANYAFDAWVIEVIPLAGAHGFVGDWGDYFLP